jgi:hypothetical protein
MTTQIIPTLTDGTPEYEQITPLGDTDYKLLFSYNPRDLHWYLTLRTEADEEIIGCEGMKLVQGGWPIRRVYDQNRPDGELLILSELLTEPGLNDLGDTSELVFIPRADLVALFNG